MKNKKKIIIPVLGIIAILAVAGILAYFTDTATVDNNIEMGVVDIEVKGYDDADKKTEWTDSKNVLPGDVLDKVVVINKTSTSVDCYIRAKINFTGDLEDVEITTEDLGLVSDWEYCKADGYYYYTKSALTTTTGIEFVKTVSIPTTIDNKGAGKTVVLEVTAEAVQARNFTPDYTNIDTVSPWKAITDTHAIKQAITTTNSVDGN